MSQSASIYRISKGYFQQLSEPDNKQHFDRDMAKDCSLFQGSFMALEFILSKAQDPAITKLASEIFNPSTSIANREMDELSSETQFESNQRGESIQFLDPDRISAIAAHLEKYSERDIRRLYDANELNREGIYPWCWQPGDSRDEAFNEKVVVEDFSELKTAFIKAKEDNDILLIFVG